MRTSSLFLGIALAGCAASASQQGHAAAELREVQACSGISPEQARGPFSHHEDIVSVEPLVAPDSEPRSPHNIGARTLFRARPGVTAAMVRRTLACERARDETLGRPERGTEQFPETVPGAEVSVAPVNDGFVVDVTTTRDADAMEILRRARALAPASR